MCCTQSDPFELFLSATDIRFCYYAETEKILGRTYGMCVLQVCLETKTICLLASQTDGACICSQYSRIPRSSIELMIRCACLEPVAVSLLRCAQCCFSTHLKLLCSHCVVTPCFFRAGFRGAFAQPFVSNHRNRRRRWYCCPSASKHFVLAAVLHHGHGELIDLTGLIVHE